MKNVTRKTAVLVVTLLVTALFSSGVSYSQFGVGGVAPDFSLQDIYGRNHKLSSMQDHSLIVLYFFNTSSPSSQDGLLILNKLIGKYGNTDLIIWGVANSPKSEVSDFIVKHHAGFPVMIDTSGVSETYQAQLILPTVVIVGPKLKIIDFFQGGGETTEKMLTSLAERELQRDAPLIAEAITQDVQQKNPANTKAKTIYGYAALKSGKTDKAEEVFTQMSADTGKTGIIGDEGLAAVYAQQGKTDQALNAAAKVEKKAPERSFVHKVKGDILYSQNKPEEALAEYQNATEKPEGEVYQKTEAHNKLGRLYASVGNYKQARVEFDQTVAIDPYNVVAMSNKGISYQKEGDWDKALAMFQQANGIKQNDVYAAALAQKAQSMIDLQKNIAEKTRIDTLVKELAERFRKQDKPLSLTEKDTWTSRPMIISFIDFQDKGGLSERDGLSMVLTTQLGSLLNDSGRVQVVERVVIDRLLEELNLGSSELADPETALKLGKVLAAKLVSTGSLLHLPDSTLLSMRMIDTETTAIPKVMTKKLAPGSADLDSEIHALNRDILKTIIEKYPLHGYIIQSSGDQATINLGSRQGVVTGTKFDVIEEGKPIEYKGKTLRGLPKTFGKIEVVTVEPDMCSVRILQKDRVLVQDDKIQEYNEAIPSKGDK
jgi:tetratricopeptide (TPR) repeat protein/peroxiredoxin